MCRYIICFLNLFVRVSLVLLNQIITDTLPTSEMLTNDGNGEKFLSNLDLQSDHLDFLFSFGN